MTVLCVSAARLELAWLLGRLENPERIGTPGKKIWTGALEGLPVILACCGIGPERARESMEFLLDRFEPVRTVHFGVCGSLTDSFLPGRVITARSVAAAWEPGAGALELFRPGGGPLAHLPEPDRPAEGIFVSNALPVSSPFVKSFLRERFRADCVDMESLEVARSCHARGIPVTVLKAVSDNAGPGLEESFRRNLSGAALAAQQSVMKYLRVLE